MSIQIPTNVLQMSTREPDVFGRTARELPLPNLGVQDEGLIQDRRLLGAEGRSLLWGWAPPEQGTTLFSIFVVLGILLLMWHHTHPVKGALGAVSKAERAK